MMFPGVMMLTTGANVVHRSSPARTVCLASRIDADQLRDQLDQLHFEASNTRAKANKARQRLLRLSEAAEKLQQQAAISVQAGKENDAREMLLQKKKAMQALEKTKSRIELLDELSTKLIEAISLRERKLVGTVALNLEIEREDDASQVRVFSPPSQSLGVDGNSEKDLLNSSEGQELQDRTYNLPTEDETNNIEGSLQVPLQLSTHGIESDNDLISRLTGLTSYEDLLDRIDQYLNKVEDEVSTVVKFSTLVLESKETPANVKLQQLMEILDAVRHVRQRIAVIMESANRSRDEIVI
ncbi:uncharacterized protein LOC112523580 isoform X1 [Cynara cardunculus var. scolymus]|uniref:uncharacterized protein LOC112523580 isoform X1 n=1 Tax=Cynara cardunculus var. scolymus TaxID=59895 RepID=UPI000D628706|nr:uncharacterized protein LOC112523580 isoform X1 [Cynara cardunculus var. scolymus]XP_024989012.1 uncharacterized protein LOC112523580 isoform X1 [Cynara cardunculus var. scolymus]XP_024989013.1 uncharacterized protein LOC112523580 isoform X1 [Cynara cardunculus var. scolymus]